MQVSPKEIEEVLMAHPDRLITDVCVGGVSGGRTSDEKVPRAWVVLSGDGQNRGTAQALRDLEAWVQKNLSKYKWLRGGIEAIDEVRDGISTGYSSHMEIPPRYPNLLQERSFDASCRTDTKDRVARISRRGCK